MKQKDSFDDIIKGRFLDWESPKGEEVDWSDISERLTEKKRSIFVWTSVRKGLALAAILASCIFGGFLYTQQVNWDDSEVAVIDERNPMDQGNQATEVVRPEESLMSEKLDKEYGQAGLDKPVEEKNSIQIKRTAVQRSTKEQTSGKENDPDKSDEPINRPEEDKQRNSIDDLSPFQFAHLEFQTMPFLLGMSSVEESRFQYSDFGRNGLNVTQDEQLPRSFVPENALKLTAESFFTSNIVYPYLNDEVIVAELGGPDRWSKARLGYGISLTYLVPVAPKINLSLGADLVSINTGISYLRADDLRNSARISQISPTLYEIETEDLAYRSYNNSTLLVGLTLGGSHTERIGRKLEQNVTVRGALLHQVHSQSILDDEMLDGSERDFIFRGIIGYELLYAVSNRSKISFGPTATWFSGSNSTPDFYYKSKSLGLSVGYLFYL